MSYYCGVREVDIDDALKAEHWVEFEREMQLWAWASGNVEVSIPSRALRMVILRHCFGAPSSCDLLSIARCSMKAGTSAVYTHATP